MNRRILWNDNWKFAKTSPDVTWEERKKWEPLLQQVDLPHDWLIYNTLQLYENSIGWYHREFTWEEAFGTLTGKGEESERVLLRFDGVYMDSSLYVNGKWVGDWKYGYSAFEWDITDYLHKGNNEAVVKVVHLAPNSRWYSGAGIYRNVWLLQVPQVHIPSDGIYVSTVEKENGYELLADTEIAWGDTTAGILGKSYQLVYTLYFENQIIFSQKKSLSCGQEKDSSSFFVENPGRWDITEPNLYRLEVTLEEGKDQKIMQKEQVMVGFRTIAFLPDKGFLLNGRKVRLNGACDHHDLGALGAAFSKAAMRRKLQMMRSMGVNAIRTSHNMPAVEVMELADEMGFLVLSEAFDMWENAKNPYDYARFFKEWAQKDVRSWIRRDRNHPCVIMWSIGNEISDTHAGEHGQDITRTLMNAVHQWDYRGNAPVTIGSNYMPWENARKCADIVKLAGYNYAEKYYREHHEEHPDWIIYGSETSSVVQSRGVYHFPLERATLIEEDEQCSALGNSTTSWAAKNAEYCITMDRNTEYSCGQFIWTAFDYIGEPTPYHTKNSYFGQIDTAGFPKDSFYLYQAEWTDYRDKPMVHVYPYWDFNVGQQVDIRVCSNAPVVELFVNGRSQGKRFIDHEKGTVLQPSWKIAYEPGSIEAAAYDEVGNKIAGEVRHSFGDSFRLAARADKEILQADGEDLIFVEISTEDKDGYPVENASDYVRVTVTGAARLVGLDNGDSTDYDQYKGIVRKLFNGKLLAVIAAKTIAGDITVKVDDARQRGILIPAVLHLQAVPAFVRPGICARTENHDMPLTYVKPGFVPVRKIELSAVEGQVISPRQPQVTVQAKIYPQDAADCSLVWKVVDAAGMESRIAGIEVLSQGHAARITGIGDGEFTVRCMSKNGTDKIKLISGLGMKAEGMGAAFVNPYEMVSGAAYSESCGDVGRGPENSACTDKELETRLIYTNLDFGDYGSDEITLSIFANDSDAHNLQIWQGIAGEEGSELVGDVIYQKPGEWEVFKPETYHLTKRMDGVASLTVVAHDKLFLKGFRFRKLEKAFEKLYVARTGVIYGDSYEKLADRVEHIGNNVSFAYEGMDFGDKGAHTITICGRTPLQSNTIQIRFAGADGSVQAVEFPHSEEYTCKTFSLEPVFGEKQVTFVFLPGCNFDFQWFWFQ